MPRRGATPTSSRGAAFGRSTLAVAVFALVVAGCTTARIVWWGHADINDYKKFDAHPVRRGPDVFQFPGPDEPTAAVVRAAFDDGAAGDRGALGSALERAQVVALLVVRDGALVYERYFNGFAADSVVPSFSVAKSVTSALVGIALAEGRIRSVEQPVTDFVPELKGRGFEKVKIRHLLRMSSGVAFREDYDHVRSDAARIYYARRLAPLLFDLQLARPPGEAFDYTSADTALLGLILRRATGETAAEYLETRLWRPLQMEYDASWSVDSASAGLEKAFCCINARARDYAKFGQLYLDQGRWNGRQVVPAEWVGASVDPALGPWEGYGHQWWLGPRANGDFWAEGINGQFVYVDPRRRIVIVMLSRQESSFNASFLRSLAEHLDEALRAAQQPPSVRQ